MSDDVNPFSAEGRYTNNPGAPSTPPPAKRNTFVWIILAVVLIGGGTLVCCGGLAFFTAMRGVAGFTAPLDHAVETLNEHPVVAEKLGTPIESGSAIGVEQYNNHNGEGDAIVDFTAVGPDDSASVRGKMKLQAGQWSPESLVIEFSDGSEVKIPESADAGTK